MYGNIVVAFDGSNESLEAARVATDIARINDSNFIAIAMVLPERAYAKILRREGDDVSAEEQIAKAEAICASVAYMDEMGIDNELVILHGNPADEVGRYAQSVGANLLVAGSRLFRKVAKGIKGGASSTGREHEQACPVLVVKERSNGTADAPDRVSFDKIVVAVDGTQESSRATLEACNLAKLQADPTIRLLTVIPVSVYSDVDFDPVLEHGARQLAIIADDTEILENAGIPGEAVLLSGRPSEEIVRYVNDSGADLLVVGTRAITRLRALMAGESVSRKVAKYVECPVLLVG